MHHNSARVRILTRQLRGGGEGGGGGARTSHSRHTTVLATVYARPKYASLNHTRRHPDHNQQTYSKGCIREPDEGETRFLNIGSLTFEPTP